MGWLGELAAVPRSRTPVAQIHEKEMAPLASCVLGYVQELLVPQRNFRRQQSRKVWSSSGQALMLPPVLELPVLVRKMDSQSRRLKLLERGIPSLRQQMVIRTKALTSCRQNSCWRMSRKFLVLYLIMIGG